jgi:hypothetical protein
VPTGEASLTDTGMTQKLRDEPDKRKGNEQSKSNKEAALNKLDD